MRLYFLFHVRTQYAIFLEANTWNTLILGTLCWGCIHLYLRVFVLMTRPPQKMEHGLFAPVFASIIVIVIVIDFRGFRFGNDNYRYRYRYRSYFGLIVPQRFWFRYPTLIMTHHDSLSVLFLFLFFNPPADGQK